MLESARKTPCTLDMLNRYLSTIEIPCTKLHYTVNGMPIIFDKYRATFKISKDFKSIIIHTFKPQEEFQSQDDKIKDMQKEQKKFLKQVEKENKRQLDLDKQKNS